MARMNEDTTVQPQDTSSQPPPVARSPSVLSSASTSDLEQRLHREELLRELWLPRVAGGLLVGVVVFWLFRWLVYGYRVAGGLALATLAVALPFLAAASVRDAQLELLVIRGRGAAVLPLVWLLVVAALVALGRWLHLV